MTVGEISGSRPGHHETPARAVGETVLISSIRHFRFYSFFFSGVISFSPLIYFLQTILKLFG